MKCIKLKNWKTGETIFTAKESCTSIAEAVKEAVTNNVDLSCVDLRGADLSYRYLYGANLTGANFKNSILQDAVLRGCSLAGADFQNSKLYNTSLYSCNLKEINFTGADLEYLGVDDSNLSGVIFADKNSIPKITNIHQKIQEAVGEGEGLHMDVWHSYCGTVHCLAGWVVTLGGKKARDLEKSLKSTAMAALAILQESSNVPLSSYDFYAGKEDALEGIKQRAEQEALQNS